MKHRIAGRRLDRTTEHRTAMFRNMVTSLIRHERIVTTTPKAKELKRICDKFITLAKKGGAHHRRIANRDVKDVEALNLMGLTSLCQEKPAEAKEWFRKSLAIDPNQTAVREAMTQLERGGSPVR